MHVPSGGNDAVVVLERSTLGEIERLAVHVGADSAGFRDQEGTGRVVLNVVIARSASGP